MELQEFRDVWMQNDKKLDRSMKLNIDLIKEIKLDKAKSILKNLTIWKFVLLPLNVLIMIWMSMFAIGNINNLALAIPAIMGFILCGITFYWEIFQLNLISKIDYSVQITFIQKKIETLKLHKLRFNKFLFIMSNTFFWILVVVALKMDLTLVIPYVWSKAAIVVLIHVGFAILWFPLAFWILSKYNTKNMISPFWRKLEKDSMLTLGSVSKSINAALSFLDEIKSFEKDESADSEESSLV